MLPTLALTHLLVQHYPRVEKFLQCFSQFQARDTVDWFAAHGVQLKTEPDGRMFRSPIIQRQSDCLTKAASLSEVEIRTGQLLKEFRGNQLGLRFR